MQLDSYKKEFSNYFNSESVVQDMQKSIDLIRSNTRGIFFIGNGGSNSICSHMMEDFMKFAKYPTYSFSDAALITCYANDYGYENAMREWLSAYFTDKDLLIAVSSSGESANILNAAKYAREKGGSVITLSGFKSGNSLKQLGDINFHIAANSYGIVECYHQVILHVILDSLND